jgi:hypothetical protein
MSRFKRQWPPGGTTCSVPALLSRPNEVAALILSAAQGTDA